MHFLVKCCLQGLLKIVKLIIISGQVRLSKCKLCRTGLEKRLEYGPAGLEPPTGARNSKKTPPQIIFNNSISSIKSESVPDPFFLKKNQITGGPGGGGNMFERYVCD